MSTQHTPFYNFEDCHRPSPAPSRATRAERLTGTETEVFISRQSCRTTNHSVKSHFQQASDPRSAVLGQVEKHTKSTPDPVTARTTASVDVGHGFHPCPRSKRAPHGRPAGGTRLPFPNFLHALPAAVRSHRGGAFGRRAEWLWGGGGGEPSNDFLIYHYRGEAQVRERENLQGYRADKETRHSRSALDPPPAAPRAPSGQEPTWPRRLTAPPASRGAPRRR